jgi:hypothetical protein
MSAINPPAKSPRSHKVLKLLGLLLVALYFVTLVGINTLAYFNSRFETSYFGFVYEAAYLNCIGHFVPPYWCQNMVRNITKKQMIK